MSVEVSVAGLGDEGRTGTQVEAPDDAAQTAYLGIRTTLADARQMVRISLNTAMVQAYWEVGRQIAQTQGERAGYGKRLLHFLAGRLTSEFGAGFDESNLRNMRRFYRAFPIRDALRPELSWTHYRELTKLSDEHQREFYAREAVDSGWTARQLHRQISTLYYERILATRDDQRTEVAAEASEREPRTTADELLKDPYVFEFLDVAEPTRFTERDLEQGLIDKLQDFLLEVGVYAAGYKTYLPTEDEFRAELERERYLLERN